MCWTAPSDVAGVKRGQIRCVTAEQATALQQQIQREKDEAAARKKREEEERQAAKRREEERKKAELERKKREEEERKAALKRQAEEKQRAAAELKRQQEIAAAERKRQAELARQAAIVKQEEDAARRKLQEQLNKQELERKKLAEQLAAHKRDLELAQKRLETIKAQEARKRADEELAAKRRQVEEREKELAWRRQWEERRAELRKRAEDPANPNIAKPITPTVARDVQAYAVLSNDAYNNQTKTPLAGYRRLDSKASGSAYASTYLSQDGKTIVIAYRGSDDRRDWTGANIPANYDRPGGLYSVPQYEFALDYAKAVQKAHPGKRVVVTGHSLGGGMASYVSNSLDVDAYTFNAARNAYSTQAKAGQTHRQVNVYSIGDAVGDPDARLGSMYGVGTGPLPGTLAGQGSLPGNTYFVDVPDLPGAGSVQGGVWNHSMQSVSGAIGEYILKSEIARRR